MKAYATVDEDRIDLICWKHYGSLGGRIVEQVLVANHGISASAELAAGVILILPDIEPQSVEDSLW